MPDSDRAHIHYKTLIRAIRDLSPEQREKLIYDIISVLEPGQVEVLQLRLPSLLQERINADRRNREQKEELIERLKRGEIDPSVPLPESYFIEGRYVPSKDKSSQYGPYYYLRWWEDGKLKTKYIGKTNPYDRGST